MGLKIEPPNKIEHFVAVVGMSSVYLLISTEKISDDRLQERKNWRIFAYMARIGLCRRKFCFDHFHFP